MTDRKAVSTRTRFEVFKRDKFACQYCGRTPPAVVLHCDHIVPVADGGQNDPLNLITACADCNLGKSDVPLGQAPRPLLDQLADETERRDQLRAYNDFLLECQAAEDDQIDALGHYWFNKQLPDDKQDAFVFGHGRIPSMRTFVRRLPIARIVEAMDIAHARIYVQEVGHDWKRWKYFCGVAWRMIREADRG